MILDRSPKPALRGFRLRNVADAQKIAEYAAQRQLGVAHRYLRKSEQSCVGPGLVWAIPTEQGKRWTDGLRDQNSPSSTKRGGFLCYPIPNPPAFPGAVPGASWIKKRTTLNVAGDDGVEREWEIVAYDYGAHTQHGLNFRDLSRDIDDLLTSPPDCDASTQLQTRLSEERPPFLTPVSPSNSAFPPTPAQRSPSPPSNDAHPPSSQEPSSLGLPPPPPAHRSLSPSASPLLSRQEHQLFPRPPTPQLPRILASSRRWHPYPRRRDPYDEYVLSRLDSRPWVARDYKRFR